MTEANTGTTLPTTLTTGSFTTATEAVVSLDDDNNKNNEEGQEVVLDDGHNERVYQQQQQQYSSDTNNQENDEMDPQDHDPQQQSQQEYEVTQEEQQQQRDDDDEPDHEEQEEEEQQQQQQQEVNNENDDVDDDNDDEEELCCYICWESNDEGQDIINPIRRDCQCKGTAGYVHIHCLVEACSAQSQHSLLDPILQPWSKCRQCLQPYKEPTKSALTRALLFDKKRLTKNLISSGSSCLITCGFYCLYFVTISTLECALEFSIVETHTNIVPFIKEIVQAMTWECKSLIVGIGIFTTCKLIWNYWEMILRGIGRILERVMTLVSAFVLLFVVLDWHLAYHYHHNSTGSSFNTDLYEQLGLHTYTYGFEDYVIIVGALTTLGIQTYRYRHEIRHEVRQIRQEGIWGIIVAAVLMIFIVVLRLTIDRYIRQGYINVRTEYYNTRGGTVHGDFYAFNDDVHDFVKTLDELIVQNKNHNNVYYDDNYQDDDSLTASYYFKYLSTSLSGTRDYTQERLLELEQQQEYLTSIREEYWYCCA